MEDSSATRPVSRRRPRRPERQQILIRRALALGGGLLLLILLVLGVKGCLDARKNRALSDYARDVTQIVEETDQTSKSFFEKLSDPSGLSVTDFVTEVEADRSAMDNYASRIDGLDAPGDMGDAQGNLELVYLLRSSAMNKIADRMSTALGDRGAEQAMNAIAAQMQTLLAADVLYAAVVRPEIDGVLADNGINGSDVPKSVFVPEGTTWLDESAVSTALSTVSGGEATTGGIHGLELSGTSISGTELSPEVTTSVTSEGPPEVEVQVENQGESAENDIGVSVTVDGGAAVEEQISTIEIGETATVMIPLTPTPEGEVTLEVKVETVPGEQISENNEASYSVAFE